jgi:probable phosphoglycerate mutase
MIDLYLFRHGQTTANADRRYVGGQSLEAKLSPKGIKQAIALGQELSRNNVEFDQIYTSTANRTIETLRHVLPDMPNVDFFGAHPELLEMDQGEWEGRLRSEVYTPEVMEKIKGDPFHFKAPGGESKEELGNRIDKWMCEYLIQCNPPNSTVKVAIFGHGFAIKSWLQKVMQFNSDLLYMMPIHNCSITRLVYNEDHWDVQCLNHNPVAAFGEMYSGEN